MKPRLNVGDSEGSGRRNAVTGLLFAGSSALAYTLTNVLLRSVADRSDVGWIAWTTCLKALPSAAAAWALIAWGALHGKNLLSDRRSTIRLMGTGLLMQVGGNFVFQYALSLGGLALSVSLCFAAIILSGAVGGRILLKEAVPRRTQIAMGILIAAVCVLQQGAGEAAQVMNRDATVWTAALAVFWACVSGCCFGLGGVAIRRSVSGTGTIAGTVAPIASVGVVLPLAVALQQLGISGLTDISLTDHVATFLAGSFNALGFFAVSAAMARVALTRVNLVNSSQVALCSLVGIVWFNEPLTGAVVAGTLLTVLSFFILGAEDRSPATEPVPILDAEQPLIAAVSPAAELTSISPIAACSTGGALSAE